MLPSAANCHGCQRRDRLIGQLQQQIAHLHKDDQRGQRRLARLKKDNERLRHELDEARRQPHRQAAVFRRRHHKKRHKRSGRPKGHPAELRPTPMPEQVDRDHPYMESANL